jgi:ABC-type polysaccharide/polyol phosphate transport system ATPase subunit
LITYRSEGGEGHRCTQIDTDKKLTGRENIYLNGAIPSTGLRAGLGMKGAEIEHKFDEIVAFAEIEKFIDTPVKHYPSTWLRAGSSGMYVRQTGDPAGCDSRGGGRPCPFG